jgi:hypothetical protein
MIIHGQFSLIAARDLAKRTELAHGRPLRLRAAEPTSLPGVRCVEQAIARLGKEIALDARWTFQPAVQTVHVVVDDARTCRDLLCHSRSCHHLAPSRRSPANSSPA